MWVCIYQLEKNLKFETFEKIVVQSNVVAKLFEMKIYSVSSLLP